jgi:N-acetyl-anhydromuramyl-L-alanine amidase AmpD
MSRIVPEKWMPACQMKGIITHWNAGAHKASELDKEHYHLLIEDDGRLIRGDHEISDNLNTGDGDYAAHTRGCNTGYIGVSLMCMGNAVQSPAYYGKWPMTKKQWETMALVCADLCERYQIPVSPTTVLGHGEVGKYLGIPQRGKWDPLALPWRPELGMYAVGELFRDEVRKALSDTNTLPTKDERTPVNILVNGVDLGVDGYLLDANTLAPVRPLAKALDAVITNVDEYKVYFVSPDNQRREALYLNHAGVGHVSVRDFATKCGKDVQWDAKSHTLNVVSRGPAF